MVVGAIQALLRVFIAQETLQSITPISLFIVGGLFTIVFVWIWFTNLWVLDKKRDAVLRGGWQEAARLSDFSRFAIQREKRDGQVMFLLMAESEKGGPSLTMCVLDQDDAHAIGRQIAQFTRLPLVDR